MKNLVKEGYVVITDTLCEGLVIAYKTTTEDREDDISEPVFFETHIEAWKEIADDMIEGLTQFTKGDRELEDTDFGTEDAPAYAKMYDDDTIEVFGIHEETGLVLDGVIFETDIKFLNS